MASNRGNWRPQSYSVVPPAIKSLIGLNVVVFGLMFLLPDTPGAGGYSLAAWVQVHFALMPSSSAFFYPYWQLISYQFMHAGLSHLFFNMLALWMFGSELERIWGSNRFLIYYLLSGIGGGLLHLAVGASGPTIGASGAIMGVLVAYGMTFPTQPVMMFPIFIPIPAKYFVMIYAAIDLFSGLSDTADNVAHFAHLGGALMGFLLIKFGDKLGVFRAAERIGDTIHNARHQQEYHGMPVREVRYRDIPPAEAAQQQDRVFHGGSFFYKGEYITEETVNRILEKINVVHYDGLDQREKEILMEISRRMN